MTAAAALLGASVTLRQMALPREGYPPHYAALRAGYCLFVGPMLGMAPPPQAMG